MEAYYINDRIPVVEGTASEGLDGEFIVFDIETTGLSAQFERITEIGAVRLKDGKVTDRFDIFVNPESRSRPRLRN